MTLNSLVAACNQKSNRDPVMTLGETEVSDAVDSLRYEHKLVAQVATAGSRAAKYRHTVESIMPHRDRDLAVMCELLVRGPQTIGELRSHTKRLCSFDSPVDIEDTVKGFIHWEHGPLACELPPGPGRREKRFAHLLSGAPPVEESIASSAIPESADSSHSAAGDRLAEISAAVEALTREVEQLRGELQDLRSRLGES